MERKGASERSKFYEYKEKKTCWPGFYTRKENQSHKNCLSQWLEKKRECVTHPSYGEKEKKKRRRKYSKIKITRDYNLARVNTRLKFNPNVQTSKNVSPRSLVFLRARKNEKEKREEEEEKEADNSRATKESKVWRRTKWKMWLPSTGRLGKKNV